MVADYAGISILEVEKLPIGLYLVLRRDAFIDRMERSESGRKYLEKCWIFEQTEPDRDALRKKFKR